MILRGRGRASTIQGRELLPEEGNLIVQQSPCRRLCLCRCLCRCRPCVSRLRHRFGLHPARRGARGRVCRFQAELRKARPCEEHPPRGVSGGESLVEHQEFPAECMMPSLVHRSFSTPCGTLTPRAHPTSRTSWCRSNPVSPVTQMTKPCPFSTVFIRRIARSSYPW